MTEPLIPFNESKLMTGSVSEIAQSADWDAAYWLAKVGPERAGMLHIYAQVFLQSLQDRIRDRIITLERQQHRDMIAAWEAKALTRSMEPASTRREVAKRPEAVAAATDEELL